MGIGPPVREEEAGLQWRRIAEGGAKCEGVGWTLGSWRGQTGGALGQGRDQKDGDIGWRVELLLWRREGGGFGRMGGDWVRTGVL